MKPRKDRSGEVVDRLLVLRAEKKRGRIYWVCRCTCGHKKNLYVRADNLGKNCRSCGCLQVEKSREANTRHGHCAGGRKSPEYNTYYSMIARCYNSHHVFFQDYGGRGITVCDRWRGPDGFKNFVTDMGPRPQPKRRFSLDRWPNVNGIYCKENCRWATAEEQANNKRDSVASAETTPSDRAWDDFD